MRQAIQQLPEEAREIILLREWEELSYQEIATVLDCPVGTVMSRLARARKIVRELLRSTHDAQPPETLSHPGLASKNGMLPTLGQAGVSGV